MTINWDRDTMSEENFNILRRVLQGARNNLWISEDEFESALSALHVASGIYTDTEVAVMFFHDNDVDDYNWRP